MHWLPMLTNYDHDVAIILRSNRLFSKYILDCILLLYMYLEASRLLVITNHIFVFISHQF